MNRRLRASLLMIFALGGASWLLHHGGSGEAQGDYLDRELRQRVEALKRDAVQPATSLAVLEERLEVLWRWTNAYSLTGGPIPVDLPQRFMVKKMALRAVSGESEDRPVAEVSSRLERFVEDVPVVALPDLDDPAGVVRDLNAFVLRYVRELTLKDELDDPLGSLSLDPPGPFRTGELVTLEQTWTVGELPMEPGGGLVLTRGGRWGTIQSEDPTGEGYVTVRTSKAGARLVPAPPWGEWRSFIARSILAFRLEGEPLATGDTVTIVYGDRSAGGPGMRLQSYSNDRIVLPVHIDLEGNGEALAPPWPGFEIVGAQEIRYVNAVAPSIVAPGEPFTLTVRSEDEKKNLSSGSTGEYRIFLDGEPWRRVPPGSPALHRIEDVSLEEPGVHRFEIRDVDGRHLGRSNPVWAQADARQRLLWGDTHGHSGFAEGQGSPDGYYRFGRDVARLDFLSLSEHDIWMDDSEWLALREAVHRWEEPGIFTPLLGYEWSALTPLGGHHNVYFSTADSRRRRVPVQEAMVQEELYRRLEEENEAADVLVIPHAHQAGNWNRSEEELERLVEITSGHGSFGFFGDKYLANGFRVGFIGSTDNHNGHPGYTGIGNQQMGGLAAVFAPENTRQAVFTALRQRRTYATTGERILLAATLNDAPMGQSVPSAELRRLRLQVSGTAPIDTVDVVKNGSVIYRRRFLDGELSPHPDRQPSGPVWVQLRFESSTEVFNGHRNPRGARPWVGSLEIEGARLLSFREPWFAHPESFEVRRSDEDPDRLELALLSRGRSKSLLLEIEGATRDSTLVLQLEGTRERPGSPGAPDRPPAELPPRTLRFRLGTLDAEPVSHELQVVRNVDRVEAQLLPPAAPLDLELEYVDPTLAQPGDYYYVRVRQVDGGTAWSSPWWVGPVGGRDEDASTGD